MKIKECPICGNKNNLPIFQQHFAKIKNITFVDKYDVIHCEKCGFIYADSLPPQEDFDRYYADVSKYEVPDDTLTDFIRKRFQKSLDFILCTIGENEKEFSKLNFVDVGCATGNFLRFLKERGYKHLNGIDPSSSCIKYLNKNKIDGINAAINDLDGKIQFDFIRLNAVLEHISDINTAIKQLKKILKKDGYLYISVPNTSGFKELRNCPFQEFSVEHINYFSLHTLSLLMLKHGFRMCKNGYKINTYDLYTELEMIFVPSEDEYNQPIRHDNSALASVKEYIKRSYGLEQIINSNIAPFVHTQEPVMIWGMGTFTLRQLVCGPLRDCNIRLYLDNNIHYQNAEYNGIPIVSPDEAVKYSYKILVASYFAQEAMINYGKNVLGLENEMVRLFTYQ